MISIIGPKGQTIPNVKINIDHYITKEQFEKLFYSEKLTLKAIAELIEYPNDLGSLSRIVRQKGWKRELGKFNKYQVNEEFFKTWTRESAWFYGWVITDGHVNNKYVDITLQKRDNDVINKLKSLIDFDGNLYIRDSKETISVHNRNVVNSLYDLGIPEKNKTFECTYPNVPKEFEWDFIRGVFEGDGSASFELKGSLRLSICGASLQFLSGIENFLKNRGVDVSLRQKNKNGKPFYEITSKNLPSALRWAYFMYANTTEEIRMNRKFGKFVDFIRNYYDRNRINSDAIDWVELIRKQIPECNDTSGIGNRLVESEAV